MRVIAGSARATRLFAPTVSPVRPMLDRVKESLFNLLAGRCEGARVVDLYSGTGSLGIEALSRGAASAVFVEADPDLIPFIRRNLEKTRLADRARIVRGDVRTALPRLQPIGPFDLVLCDPPYETVSDPVLRSRLCETLDRWVVAPDLFHPHTTLMIHHGPPATILWHFRRFALTRFRQYGKSVLSFFEPVAQPESPPC
jgi:16S rRNA (guanine(966)-N(2))-methyltransferase RsmD